MRVSEALEIFEQSPGSFKAEIERLSIKELYGLVKDLTLINKPQVFKISHDILLNKLSNLLEGVEGFKISTDDGLLVVRRHIYEETGFNLDLKAPLGSSLREIINKVASWSQ